MPFEGEKLDELLSGFIDGELSDSELNFVEEALATNPAMRQRTEELRQLRSELKLVGQRLSGRASLPSNFSSRVLAAARKHESGLNSTRLPELAVSEIALSEIAAADRGSTVRLSDRKQNRWRKLGLSFGAIATTAALILLSISIPELWKQQQGGQQVAEAEPAPLLVGEDAISQPPQGHYIGDGEFKVAYALIVDVQITENALQADVLGNVLAASGIYQAQPIAANRGIQAALENSRMIVQVQSSEKSQDTILYLIRADIHDLDAALQTIWNDKSNFPNVSFDLAIDNPKSGLVREIIRSTGTRFTADDSFAAPVAVGDAGFEVPGDVSPFPGSAAGVKYVSSQSRNRGWNGGAMPVPSADQKATILLVAHIVGQ